MEDTLKRSQARLTRPITSVVVITLMAGFFFSAPQTYALGTNENFLANLDQSYQQTSKLSDFVSKVFSFFSEQSSVQGNEQNNLLAGQSIAPKQLACTKDLWLPFIDIQDSIYKDYIMILYSKGIVIWSTNKFMPNDDLRFYCMIKILVDSYRSKVWYDLKTQLWLSQKNYFLTAWSDIDKSFLKYLNTAYELWFLEWIDNLDISSNIYFQKNTSFSTIRQIFTNINKQFPLLSDSWGMPQIPAIEATITRGEYTKYVVNYFWLKASNNTQPLCSGDWKNNFSDIMNNDYQEDIQVLADLWIINAQAYKFYPENYLRNYEFIIMLTKTILKKENQELNVYVLDHVANISGLNPEESYAKYFEYAYHNWFLDYWFDTKTWKPTVHPNGLVNIQDMNRILSKLVGKEINFKVKSNDGMVTRWEFADILVDWFNLGYGSANDTTNITIKEGIKPSLLQEIWLRLQSTKLLSKL